MGVPFLAGIEVAELTTAQRDSLPADRRDKGTVIFNTTTGKPEINLGTGTAPKWVPWSLSGWETIFDVQVGRGNPGDPAAPAASLDSNTILGGDIPQIYDHLLCVLKLRTSAATVPGAATRANMRFNNDSLANYTNEATDGLAEIRVGYQVLATNGSPADSFLTTIINIPFYRDAMLKHVHRTEYSIYGATAFGSISYRSAWKSAAAITRIALTDQEANNFVSGCRWMLSGYRL